MKRILLLVCCLSFACAGTAEARWFRRSSSTNTNYQPTYTTYKPSVSATQVSYSRPATTTTTAGYSTATAQGVAQIMASCGRVGHWGGNPGYEGCGSGATAAAAYNNCCYANSGMATVDVGYARGASGMWFCCRRYR